MVGYVRKRGGISMSRSATGFGKSVRLSGYNTKPAMFPASSHRCRDRCPASEEMSELRGLDKLDPLRAESPARAMSRSGRIDIEIGHPGPTSGGRDHGVPLAGESPRRAELGVVDMGHQQEPAHRRGRHGRPQASKKSPPRGPQEFREAHQRCERDRSDQENRPRVPRGSDVDRREAQ